MKVILVFDDRWYLYRVGVFFEVCIRRLSILLEDSSESYYLSDINISVVVRRRIKMCVVLVTSLQHSSPIKISFA